jgi:hypothetical protein
MRSASTYAPLGEHRDREFLFEVAGDPCLEFT